MPCTDWGRPVELETRRSKLDKALRALRIRPGLDIDRDTRKLCKLLSEKSKREINSMPVEVQIWWIDHQAADRKKDHP